MPTVDSVGIADEVEEICQLSSQALRDRTADGFETLEHHLARFEAHVREAFQAVYASEARLAIAHLENNAPLTDADRDVIRAFLVADADAYVQHENDFENWCSELERLTGRIAEFGQAETGEALAALRGIVLDAVRLVPDIRNYLDQRRRIEKFERALMTLDNTSRRLLAQLMSEQVQSPAR